MQRDHSAITFVTVETAFIVNFTSLAKLFVDCLTSQQHAKCISGTGSAQTIVCATKKNKKLQIFLSHPVKAYWHQANRFQDWFYTRRLTKYALECQFLHKFSIQNVTNTYQGQHIFLQPSAKGVNAATMFFTLTSGNARTTAATSLYTARLDAASWYRPTVAASSLNIPLTASSGSSVHNKNDGHGHTNLLGNSLCPLFLLFFSFFFFLFITRKPYERPKLPISPSLSFSSLTISLQESWWNWEWQGWLLKRRNVFLPNQGKKSGKICLGKCNQIHTYDVYRGFQRKEQTLAEAADLQHSATQTANRTPWTMWCHLNTHKRDQNSNPGSKGHHATWKLRCEQGLSTLKAMTAKGTEQRHVICSCYIRVRHSESLTTIWVSYSNLLKLDRVQLIVMKVILWTRKDTPTEAMSTCQTCHHPTTQKMEQIKAHFNAMQNPKNPLHIAVLEEKGCRL